MIQRRIQDRRTRRAPPVWNWGGGAVFVNLNGETRIYSDLSQNTMSYSILLLQNIRYVCEGVSKQTPDLGILTRPPVLKFLDPQLWLLLFFQKPRKPPLTSRDPVSRHHTVIHIFISLLTKKMFEFYMYMYMHNNLFNCKYKKKKKMFESYMYMHYLFNCEYKKS